MNEGGSVLDFAIADCAVKGKMYIWYLTSSSAVWPLLRSGQLGLAIIGL